MTTKMNTAKNNFSDRHSQPNEKKEKRHISRFDSGAVPRLLNRQQAASYCGTSTPTFAAVCPIHPVALGKGKRLERYDIRQLDKWIDALGSKDTSSRKDWLTAWDEKS
jgi:hypothetical protein